ncbi:autotransporter domain-containing protein [Bosea sp. LjRoot90]|uniref:autotransporter outer membrane beta-barrel domain-containing protein n=1 Tax=Bosea sp. LjRoot90 TaxID=3342342 RepID=UPI003ECDF3A8
MTAGPRRSSAHLGVLLRSVSITTLTLAAWVASPAAAGTYTASSQAELVTAVQAANADPDPTATIRLTGSFTMSTTSFSPPTKPITIDTQGFTISGTDGTGVTPGGYLHIVEVFGGSPGSFTLMGNFRGGNAVSADAGSGIRTRLGATVINNGIIQGGNSTGAGGGAGVELFAPNPDAFTNNGTVRGGTGPTNGTSGFGAGIWVRNAPTQPIVNTGTIEGGAGAAAIVLGANNTNLVLVNSGTIRAGAGQANAIQWASSITPTTGRIDLELRAGSVITGNVVANLAGSNDVLRLGGSDNWTLDGGLGSAGQYRNFDRLEKTGASTWTIGGSGNFAGPTNIAGGTLIVNGSLSGSAVTVQSGARLGGSGTVGATTLASGSRITPGNSIGTLTVNGAYVQNAGAVYEVEIDPGTVTSDRIQVNGTATLASGAAISVVNTTGAAYVAGQRYTILTSTGLAGSYGSTDLTLTPFLNLRNGTDASNAYLTVIRTNTAGGIGTTPNEVSVGASVDSLPAGNAVQTDVYNQASLDAARRALGQLAGEIHASARTVLVDESWLLRAAVNDRLRSAFGAVGASPMATLDYGFTADLAPAVKGPMPKLPSAERFAIWGQGYGSWGRIDGDGNAAKLTHSTGGLLIGADVAAFDNLRFGVVAGYSRSTFDVNGRLSSGESDNYHLGLYGGAQWGALSLRTGLSYTWHDLSTRRGIVSAGLGDLLRADYDAGTAQVFGEFGYRIELGQTALGRVALEPFAGLAYVVLRSDGFSERGGAAALSGTSDDTSLGYATLGLRAATSGRIAGMDVTLRGGLGWRHAFGDVDPKTALAFAGGTPFTIAGLPIARNAALVEAGLDMAIGANVTLGASYTAQLADDAQDHAFKANLAVRF